MDLGLQGKTALVVAASTGLGRAAGVALGREGARVALASRSEERLASAVAAVEKAGGEATAIPCDLADAASIDRLLAGTERALGGVDILVTNAGGPPPGGLGDLGDDAWRAAAEQLLLAPVRLLRGVIPQMKEKGWGRIIPIVSISVKQPIENLLLSNAIRPGVVGLAKTLSFELAPHGITVNCVAPSYTRTGRLGELAEAKAKKTGTSVEQVFAGMKTTIPAGRLGEPEEFGDLVAFLASERAAFLTGLTIPFDGGSTRGLL
jgi:3-oxoacyl-[acyl-carrier protein] reductase